MRMHIKTTKPDEMEEFLENTVLELRKGYKPTRKMQLLMKIGRIDSNIINAGTHFEYKKIGGNTFEFLLIYPMESITARIMFDQLAKQFRKIDDKIEMELIK